MHCRTRFRKSKDVSVSCCVSLVPLLIPVSGGGQYAFIKSWRSPLRSQAPKLCCTALATKFYTMADRILLEQCSFGPPVDRPFALIHKAFENFADVTPDTLAAVHNKSSVTYGELEAAANRLSHDLVSLGVKLYQRISLVVSRSIEMLVAILAVLKCGCQYIPLNGQVVTQKTLLHIIQDADVQLVLCLERFKLQCLDPFNPGVKVKVVDGYHDQEHQPSCRLDYDIDLADGAYIIYTSGLSAYMP